MRRSLARLLLVLVAVGMVSGACVIRSKPGRSRHGIVNDDAKHKKHKKHKKPKKHKKHKGWD